MIHRIGLSPALSTILLAALVTSVGAAMTDPTPLAIVGPDTLTTEDLQLELNVMLRAVANQPEIDRPEADAVLTRLIQDRLLVQEGYRIGIDQRFTVKNQVVTLVREKSMTALLDSIASTALVDSLEYRRAAVEGFIEDLKVAYEVKVDSTLLASLDYGSEDPDVYQELRRSEEVLVTMKGRVLKVRGLTQVISWEEFHGISGQSDADEIRDRIFKSWLSETLVMLEARALGFDKRPEILALAKVVERALVHEETFRALIDVDFEPTEEEIQAFYEANIGEFTAKPKIKLESVLLNAEEPALKFCDRLRQGAKLSWLAKQTKEVVPGPSPFPSEWYLPEKLGVDPAKAVVGYVPEPYEIPGGGWVAAIVSDVETPAPMPLDQCTRQVQAMMKGQHLQNAVVDVVSRLEADADITILPGAEETVDKHLDAAIASLAK